MEKKYRGKSNISILRDYVDGVRPFVTTGYTPPTITRKMGDEWVDNKGISWKQEDGFKRRINKQADIIRKAIHQTCNVCKADIRWGDKLDKKMFYRTGLCFDCLINYETKLRIAGVYPEYERYKMISYELGFIKEARDKILEVIKYFTENSGDMEMICNSEGFIERWKNTNGADILENAKKDLVLAKKRIALVTKAKNEAKKKYIAGAKKFKLETYV